MYKLIRPLLFHYDAEEIHDKVLRIGEWLGRSKWKKFFEWWSMYNHPSLHIKVCGIPFKNPVGLAAGFDKNGILVDFLPALGFGFLEIGSISSLSCDGNQKPRLFRLPEDEAIINRMGLNNLGAENIAERLRGRKHEIPLGIKKTN